MLKSRKLIYVILSLVSMVAVEMFPQKRNLDRLSQQQTEPSSIYALTPISQGLIDSIISKYQYMRPVHWGETVPGVITKINTRNKVVALTFDACGGSVASNGYDMDLIDFLIKENVPATLFINSRWIDANYNIFMKLAGNPLFEIENHGYLHKPLSVNGKSAYGIPGTLNAGEVIDEVLLNEQKIENLTGRKPLYFRSGTAYYDEVAVKIVYDLGLKPIGFNILGDAGANFNTKQVANACLSAVPGSIIILHMNHPEKYTAEGIKLAVPELKKRGFSFTKLESYDNGYFSTASGR
jgi:peptidoglycan/xylan/chitin deacetylase (PgdA/CDA1 family)